MKNLLMTVALGATLLPVVSFASVNTPLGFTAIPIEIQVTNQDTVNNNPITVAYSFNSSLQNVNKWEGPETPSVTAAMNSTTSEQPITLLNYAGQPIGGSITINFTASITGYQSVVASTGPITISDNQLPSKNFPDFINPSGNFACSLSTNTVGIYWVITAACESGQR